jgi:hypothetical protein
MLTAVGSQYDLLPAARAVIFVSFLGRSGSAALVRATVNCYSLIVVALNSAVSQSSANLAPRDREARKANLLPAQWVNQTLRRARGAHFSKRESCARATGRGLAKVQTKYLVAIH